ncbi:DUF1127 domain-containing protein [Thiosulfatihalobacter marinus]|jgi:uncharacterized protein YjiS (DUF1127 family)|uniref:DUF1127 domain-containing protein n=1 Tax=Thiosulfatihalobacter marinus TaxID=2792481 RepID=UPI0018D714F7|nr:DUF1127 domain-containing protein [Thiosulfatihalobacter marinus]
MASYDSVYAPTFSGRFGQTFAALLATFTSWNDRRMTRNALRGLSDRELDDIGLSRGDIESFI